jgi:hypothetical protein
MKKFLTLLFRIMFRENPLPVTQPKVPRRRVDHLCWPTDEPLPESNNEVRVLTYYILIGSYHEQPNGIGGIFKSALETGIDVIATDVDALYFLCNYMGYEFQDYHYKDRHNVPAPELIGTRLCPSSHCPEKEN